MKVAFVHDWLTAFGGAERVLLKLHTIFPEAPIYTLVYDEKTMEKFFPNVKIIPSYLQKIPGVIKHYRNLLPLMPTAIEQFDLSDYDLIISSSWACAKGVNVNANTTHICYCHTPMRYAWDLYNEYNNGKNKVKKLFIANRMNRIRMWDRLSADRVDCFIANSNNVAKRIAKHYRRESEVVYPFVGKEFYLEKLNNKPKEYYLTVARLIAYKKIDIIIEAFNKLGIELHVVGSGPDKNKLKKIANKNIVFLENLSEKELRNEYIKAKAFVFAAQEDFGMVMAEAQACGVPVIAYKKGGANEIVIENQTGYLYENQTKEDIIKTIGKFENNVNEFSREEIRKTAIRFHEDEFMKKIKEIISSQINSKR